jgi:predicted nucleic acid-binding protein
VTLLVLDASVAAKWFLPRAGEPLVEEAFELLGRHAAGEISFTVPDLFWAEFGNICWKAARAGRWKPSAAAAAVGLMREQTLDTVSSRELLGDAVPVAFATGRSVHDCLYVVLAVQAGAEMVSGDERLVRAVAGEFPVKLLGSV